MRKAKSGTPARRAAPPQFLPEPLEGRTLMSLPAGFAQTTFARGVTEPTAMAFAPDGRLFVCEQGGDVRVVTPQGQLLATPFAHVDAHNADEQGLIGITFHPDFATNGWVYLSYATATALNQVARVTANPANPNVAVAGSLTEILTLPRDETYGYNHQGGALGFGADGKLYWTSGEHNNPSYAQDLQWPYGKVLRLNDDGTFPTDNPFYDQGGWARAVYALGLRNPFTFAIQPGTGQILLNDVGGGLKEEVNLVTAGKNFGWPTTEGSFNPAQYPAFTNPVHDYERGIVGCAIIGGAFYNPPAGATSLFPSSYTGKYFFSDYCMRFVHVLDPANGYAHTVFGTNNQLPEEAVDLEVGPDGALYGLSRGPGAVAGAGVVVRIGYTGSDAPVISSDPRSQTATLGQRVTFDVTASGAPPLSYKWQRKSVGAASFTDIAGATASSYTIDAVTAADDGAQFRCVVSNGSGSDTSAAATLTVTDNRPPVVQINFPAEGALYTAGQTIQYAGVATDPEEGSLASSQYTWWVDLHHDTHTHPAMPQTSGSAFGSFTVPTTGETSPNVWFRIHLKATDSEGLSTETYRDVHPQTSVFTLATQPAGLSLTLDGAGVATPRPVTGVVGITRTIGAPATQNFNGVDYEFVSWSDGGARDHAISTPANNTTYTAVYRPVTTIAGRYVFYNYSAYDGRTPGAAAADDGAIATDKQALRPGQAATFANYTSFPGGINGVMVDLTNGGMPITAENFVFRVGNDANTGAWAAAPAPLSITRRDGAGVGGSDRVTITWPFASIRNKWLQVGLRPVPGAPVSDVFYFGSAVGETGDNPANAVVNSADLFAVRSHLRSTGGVGNRWDVNRDGRVNTQDLTVVRRYRTVAGRALALVTAPVQASIIAAAAAPTRLGAGEVLPRSDYGSASALVRDGG
jgi:glucose/arabinose dehydrogenase